VNNLIQRQCELDYCDKDSEPLSSLSGKKHCAPLVMTEESEGKEWGWGCRFVVGCLLSTCKVSTGEGWEGKEGKEWRWHICSVFASYEVCFKEATLRWKFAGGLSIGVHLGTSPGCEGSWVGQQRPQHIVRGHLELSAIETRHGPVIARGVVLEIRGTICPGSCVLSAARNELSDPNYVSPFPPCW
jgi:hypothetical protein